MCEAHGEQRMVLACEEPPIPKIVEAVLAAPPYHTLLDSMHAQLGSRGMIVPNVAPSEARPRLLCDSYGPRPSDHISPVPLPSFLTS